MSSHFPLLAPNELSADQQELYEKITAGPRANGPFRIMHDDGSLAGPFNALLFAPRIGNAVQELGAALRFGAGSRGVGRWARGKRGRWRYGTVPLSVSSCVCAFVRS